MNVTNLNTKEETEKTKKNERSSSYKGKLSIFLIN